MSNDAKPTMIVDVPIPHRPSEGKRDRNATAKRMSDGTIVITGIGYYDDEITLTTSQLEQLGYIDFFNEAP